MNIKSALRNYEVNIYNDFSFFEIIFETDNTFFVIDKNVYELYENLFSNLPMENILILEATEQNKTIETALSICEKMTAMAAKRNSRLISVGGGIIQDITGFAANILYRGIDWIFVPTTVLAACDSCIGGKTSLNYKKYKNLLGTFYPPSKIYICPLFFKTLPQRDFNSGLGEVIKFNIMAGNEFLEKIKNDIDALIIGNSVVVSQYLNSSLNYKKKFIETDEFDKGERIKLNFAHTFGHAIEVISDYAIPHGTAVAIGMIMADSISVKRGILNHSIAEQAEKILLKVISIPQNLSLSDFNQEDILSIIRKDKKQIGNSLTAVIMTDDSEQRLKIIHDLTADEVIYAFRYFVSKYNAREGNTR